MELDIMKEIQFIERFEDFFEKISEFNILIFQQKYWNFQLLKSHCSFFSIFINLLIWDCKLFGEISLMRKIKNKIQISTILIRQFILYLHEKILKIYNYF